VLDKVEGGNYRDGFCGNLLEIIDRVLLGNVETFGPAVASAARIGIDA
jgi:hypothetical protein